MTKILVPTAGCTAAAETADYVMQVARAINADVVVLHVIKSGGSKEAGELYLEYFANAGEENDVHVECHFQEGAVAHAIADFAEENEVDLIVMGASQGRVVDQWLSSDVRESTSIPVLIIPFQIFE